MPSHDILDNKSLLHDCFDLGQLRRWVCRTPTATLPRANSGVLLGNYTIPRCTFGELNTKQYQTNTYFFKGGFALKVML